MRAMAKKKSKKPDNVIAQNKRAKFDYNLEETFEAGVELRGWEVKSLRMGKVQISDTYVLMKNGEAFLLGAVITPLDTASTHFVTEPDRTRRLLLHKKELAKILSATKAKGMACVCTSLYWKGHLVKARIALGRGKQDHDKRDTVKDREWGVQKRRIMREATKQ
jgi:SsrA-binding protein